jgi:hypothetical protein
MKSVEPAVSPSGPSGHGGRDVFAAPVLDVQDGDADVALCVHDVPDQVDVPDRMPAQILCFHPIRLARPVPAQPRGHFHGPPTHHGSGTDAIAFRNVPVMAAPSRVRTSTDLSVSRTLRAVPVLPDRRAAVMSMIDAMIAKLQTT